jgi:hypothetical protein
MNAFNSADTGDPETIRPLCPQCRVMSNWEQTLSIEHNRLVSPRVCPQPHSLKRYFRLADAFCIPFPGFPDEPLRCAVSLRRAAKHPKR